MKRRNVLMISVVFLVLSVGIAGAQLTSAPQTQVPLPGGFIPKFISQLPLAGDISVVDATTLGTCSYNLHLREFQAQILPDFCKPSWVWGYLTDADAAALDADPTLVRQSSLGPVVVAKRGVPTYPTYLNELPDGAVSMVQGNLPIDMTTDWANPMNIDCAPNPVTGDYTNPLCGVLPSYLGPLPDSVHIHGGEVPPASDGGPDSWYTQDDPTRPGTPLYTGIGFPGKTLTYPNGQEEATIWFHPHGFGITRLNVFAGLAGLYPIVDTGGPSAPVATMPAFPQHDIPLIIQDRTFDMNGQVFYNLASNPQPNPTVHPFWIPEFIGDVITVNGKAWPNLNVEPRQYRFRLLNGSNARFYNLTLHTTTTTAAGVIRYTAVTMPMIAIATDGGYLANAVSTTNVLISPGERYEVIADFTGLPVGTQIMMVNTARTPFPGGAAPTFDTRQVMLFTVVPDASGLPNTTVADLTPIRPAPLQPIVNAHNPATGSITRQLTLNEVIGAGGPLELVINNSKYNLPALLPGDTSTPLARETELPAVGDTEIWEIINISADAHPMHTHLTTFQILDRTPFRSPKWLAQYDALMLANGVLPGAGPPNPYNVKNADGAIGGNPAINSLLLLANRKPPLPYEMGWKDTAIMYPGQVTRIAIRWAPQDAPATGAGAPAPGTNLYPFDPSALSGGVGYVWHCHILDHEDNEMMRNYLVRNARQTVN